RDGIRFLGRHVRIAAGEGGSGNDVVVVPGVAHVDTAAGLVEALAQGGSAHVAGAGGAEAELVVDGPVQADLPGPDFTGTGVVGPAGSPGRFQVVREGGIFEQGYIEFGEGFL